MTEEELLRVIEQAAQEGARELHLWSNQLSALPPEIGQLTNLRWLDLRNNQLSALPAEIVQLTNLDFGTKGVVRRSGRCEGNSRFLFPGVRPQRNRTPLRSEILDCRRRGSR